MTKNAVHPAMHCVFYAQVQKICRLPGNITKAEAERLCAVTKSM